MILHARLIRAVCQEKAASAQQQIADSVRPSRREPADSPRRMAWRREEDCARGQWEARNRAAWIATKEFLRNNGK